MVGKYKVITLCGSTRFKDTFMEAQKRLTLEGNIVISVGLFGHSGDDEVWTEGTKEMLDDMHKRKIDKNAADLPSVGLEHLMPGDLSLNHWSESDENTFTRLFHKGQVLFGRRRAYLKKAVVAPFDGVCSGDIIAI